MKTFLFALFNAGEFSFLDILTSVDFSLDIENEYYHSMICVTSSHDL